MKRSTLHIILTSIGVAIVAAYAIFALTSLPDTQASVVCKNVEICITDSAERGYVSVRDIERYLNECDLYPLNMAYNDIACHKIEKAVLNHDMVETAECYKTPEGKVVITIAQRQPLFRVMGDENYFVDTRRKVMPVRTTTATYVPVVTGRCTKKLATGDMYDFVNWLTKNDFWNAQVEQIVVNQRLEVELVPRIGSGVILLGKLDDYEKKLDKLMTLYKDGFNKAGWTQYKEIDLRYKGQIVGRK